MKHYSLSPARFFNFFYQIWSITKYSKFLRFLVLCYSLQLITNERFLLYLKESLSTSAPILYGHYFGPRGRYHKYVCARSFSFQADRSESHPSIKVAMNLILVIADRLHCCPSLVAFLRKWCITVQRTCLTKMMFCLNRNVAFVKCTQLNFLTLLTW